MRFTADMVCGSRSFRC